MTTPIERALQRIQTEERKAALRQLANAPPKKVPESDWAWREDGWLK